MTTIEHELIVEFNKKYGEHDLSKRIEKLKEEFGELIEAYESSEDMCKLIDEASDVQAVLAHILFRLGITVDKALLNALLKSKIREIDKNYKKQ